MGEIWKTIIVGSFNKFLGKVTTFLPNLLAMVLILIVGFLTACLLKRIILRFLQALHFDRISERWGLTHILFERGVTHSPSNLLSHFAYWVIVLITLILGINALEVAATQDLVSKFFNYLPNLLAAMIILVVGYLIALFLGQAALIAAVNAQIGSAGLFGRTVRWFFIVLSLTMALYHLGIAEKVVLAAFFIILGGVVLALAIAFGWGGRELAKDFLERLYDRKEKGDKKEDDISHI